YMYPLMELHDYALKMQRDMIHEIEAVRPEYVVFTDVSLSWLRLPGSKHEVDDWWQNYWTEHYDLARRFSIETEKREGEAEKPATAGDVLVFRRKAAASPYPPAGPFARAGSAESAGAVFGNKSAPPTPHFARRYFHATLRQPKP